MKFTAKRRQVLKEFKMIYSEVFEERNNNTSLRNTVSIAMATYNGALFIKEQIESIVNQTYPPDEIVIVDDCSTDDSVSIIEEILKNSAIKRKIVRNEFRVGWRQNFINVMSLCECDLIAFCDQDDVWEANKLEVLVSSFVSPDIKMVYHNAILIDKIGNAIGSLNEKARGEKIRSPSLTMDFWKPIFGFSIVFRKELLQFSPYWIYSIDKLNKEEKAAHDQWVFFLSSVLGEIIYVDSNLVRYRIHGNNSVGLRVSSKSLKDYYIIYKNSSAKLNDRNLIIKNRISLLAKMISDFPLLEKLRTAAIAYENHLEFNESRIKMYKQSGVHNRLLTLANFHRRSRYQSDTLPLSSGEKVRDLVVAVIGL